MRTLLLLALFPACSPSVAPSEAPKEAMQRTRAGYSANGSFVSTHLLLHGDTDGGELGGAIPCELGELQVTMSYSTQGDTGPWTEISTDLIVRCGGGTNGDLAIVVDNSGSTASVVDTLTTASSGLIDDVIASGGRASITRVSTEAQPLHPLSSDAQSLQAALNDGLITGSNGWTALWDGVRVGNESFGGAVAHRDGAVSWDSLEDFCGASDRLGILAFTDGQENNSNDQQAYDHEAYPGDGFNTTLDDLKHLHVAGQTTPIYTVSLGDAPDTEALRELSDATGGVHTAISDVSQISDVFETVADYFESSYQVCGALPEIVCGTTHIKIEWTRTLEGFELDSGELIQGVTVDCPIDPPVGRSSTIMLTLTNPSLPPDEVDTFVANTAEWVAGSQTDPRILVVLDDNHHNEFAGDADAIQGMLQHHGYTVDRLDEPTQGLSAADLDGYDVVWFSNPGYPPDDLASIQALGAFNAAGGGLVLQGDDISWSWGNAFSMDELTGLSYVSNGTQTCGQHTDNNAGARFSVEQTSAHPVFAGIEGAVWLYGDDIDDTVSANNGANIVVEAGLEGDPTCPTRPVVTVRDPEN